MGQNIEKAVDLIFEDDIEGAKAAILLENDEITLVRKLGNPTLLNYLTKFEEYLDQHDIYLFDGWEDAEVCRKPVIEKFWATFYLMVGPKTDLRGAKRLINSKEAQNRIQVKKYNDKMVIKFRILKRYLDSIEKQNQEKSDQMTDDFQEEN